MALYRRFLDGIPEYLARHYWWAYLWPFGIWFFDHQTIINAILFGQYQRLMSRTLDHLDLRNHARVLQLTCAYGKLTPELLRRLPQGLDLMDVAMQQLEETASKCNSLPPLRMVRMNAEQLAYESECFDQVIVFFLFHELPVKARARAIEEIARVIRPGGSIVVTEYAAAPEQHFLYRMRPMRWILGRLEPFLPGFWKEDLNAAVQNACIGSGKKIASIREDKFFNGFYRVVAYHLQQEG